MEQNDRIISHTLTRGCARKLEDVDLQEDERVVDESFASRNGLKFITSIDSLTKQYDGFIGLGRCSSCCK